MEPGVGRALGQGFRTANRSWAGMGVFAGGWILTIALVIGAVLLTSPPPALFQEEGALPATLAPRADTTAPEAPAAPASSAAPADLFDQLQTTAPPETSATPVPEATTPATAPATPAADVTSRDRLIEAWLGRAWPLLLLCVLVLIAANTWLVGGQIGYLANVVRTQRSSVAEFFRAGTRSFWSLLGGWCLTMLAGILGVLALALVVWGLSALPSGVRLVLGLVLGVLALMALIWLWVKLIFWFIAVVADHCGPISGVGASFRAVRGHWWRLAWLSALLLLICFGVSFLIALCDALGRVIGGSGGLVITLLCNLLGLAANLYLGFVMAAAWVQFYEDVKSQTTPAAAPATPAT